MSSCLRCGKKFDDGKLWKTTYSICYDKCRGKTCPDCGKVRKLGGFETIYTENPRFNSPCVRCKKITNHLINKVCAKCFSERERKRGCFCIWDKDRNEKKGYHNNINYYCPLCEDIHPREALCKECFEKQLKLNENKRTFFRVILPSAIVGLVIGFFLGWLFFKKLRKMKKND